MDEFRDGLMGAADYGAVDPRQRKWDTITCIDFSIATKITPVYPRLLCCIYPILLNNLMRRCIAVCLFL